MKLAREKRMGYIFPMSKYVTSRVKRHHKVKETAAIYLAAPMNSIELFAGAGGLVSALPMQDLSIA